MLASKHNQFLTNVHTSPTTSMTKILSRSVRATIAVFSIAAAASVAGAQSINLPDNETPTFYFGKGGASATYGQTFTAPTGGNFLQTFSFWLGDDPQGLGTTNAPSLLFQAYVMQWDAANGHATGPVLYSSSVYGGPTSLSQRYDFASPNVAVSAGTQYVAFLSASNSFGNIVPTDATALMETSLLGTYTGGAFVFTDNGSDFNSLSTNPWDFTGFGPDYQAHFAADFSANAVSVVPEPSSLVLLVAGLSTLMVLAVRKKRA